MNARITTNRIVLITSSVLLTLGGAEAWAGTINYQADYLTVSGQNCTNSFCFPITPGATFVEAFTINSTQLGTDGSYDVTGSLNPTLPIPGWTTSTFIADAVVSGGAVTDLVLNFTANVSSSNPITGSTFQNTSFQASGGNWSTNGSFVNTGLETSGSNNAAGTYTVLATPVTTPEPGSVGLVVAGALLMPLVRRKLRT